MEINIHSVLTCPACEFQKEEKMSLNSCQWFYECEQCRHLMKPKPGDCCVYCSYGSVKCPPVQEDKQCCQN